MVSQETMLAQMLVLAEYLIVPHETMLAQAAALAEQFMVPQETMLAQKIILAEHLNGTSGDNAGLEDNID